MTILWTCLLGSVFVLSLYLLADTFMFVCVCMFAFSLFVGFALRALVLVLDSRLGLVCFHLCVLLTSIEYPARRVCVCVGNPPDLWSKRPHDDLVLPFPPRPHVPGPPRSYTCWVLCRQQWRLPRLTEFQATISGMPSPDIPPWYADLPSVMEDIVAFSVSALFSPTGRQKQGQQATQATSAVLW